MSSFALNNSHGATKKVRMNFEVSENRKKQIKTYTSLKGISIKEFFDEFLTSKFGPETSVVTTQVENEQADIAELNEEEANFFAKEDAFWADHPEALANAMSLAQMEAVIQRIQSGEVFDLAEALGMKEYVSE